MRRTNPMPRTVLQNVLLGLALGSTATAQQPPVQPPPAPAPAAAPAPAGRRSLYIARESTHRVQMSTRGRIDKVLNPKDVIVRVSPVPDDPTSIFVTGLEVGVAPITLIGENNAQESIDVFVQVDLEYLRTLLVQVVPTANIRPVPGQ